VKEQAQHLEESLSSEIYKAEQLIQETKVGGGEGLQGLNRRRTILKRIGDGLAW
jgi:hypothetical protein